MQIQTDRALIPATADAVRYLSVKISAPQRERRADRTPAAVSLVLDRSGSIAVGAGAAVDFAHVRVIAAIFVGQAVADIAAFAIAGVNSFEANP